MTCRNVLEEIKIQKKAKRLHVLTEWGILYFSEICVIEWNYMEYVRRRIIRKEEENKWKRDAIGMAFRLPNASRAFWMNYLAAQAHENVPVARWKRDPKIKISSMVCWGGCARVSDGQIEYEFSGSENLAAMRNDAIGGYSPCKTKNFGAKIGFTSSSTNLFFFSLILISSSSMSNDVLQWCSQCHHKSSR